MSSFQEAQRRLNLVKTHAHELVGVKREQVNRVVESTGKPGTYDITVHDSGRVYTQSWVPPKPEDFSPLVFSEPVEAESEVAEGEPEVKEEVFSPEEKLNRFLEEEKGRLAAQGDVEEDVQTASADAPPRRGRPPKPKYGQK